jgi:ribonuclease R
MDAERESIKYKQVEYMQDSVGKTFDGRISGMIAKGLFIELTESRAEGMISFDKMKEAFDLETGNYIAKGRRTGKVYRIGDPIRVVITNTDLMERKIDMVEAED